MSTDYRDYQRIDGTVHNCDDCKMRFTYAGDDENPPCPHCEVGL